MTYCKYCGENIPDHASVCPRCGNSVGSFSTRCDSQEVKKPSAHLALSILVTIFCCLPFGIVGIVYASKVDSNWMAGYYDLARQNSLKARNWSVTGIVIGAVLWVLYLILVYVIGLSMLSLSEWDSVYYSSLV